MTTQEKPLGHLLHVFEEKRTYRRIVQYYFACSNEEADSVILAAVEKVHRLLDEPFLTGDRGPLVAYFNTAVKNTAITELRKRVYRNKHVLLECNAPQGSLNYLEEMSGVYEDVHEDPYQRTLDSYKILLVRRLRYLLTPQKRRMLKLYVKGSSYQQIAAKLGVNLNTVKSTLHKTRIITNSDPVLLDIINQLELKNLLL